MPRTRVILQEARQTLVLAVPITAGQLGQMLLGFSDSLMVGRLGVVPLAASAFAIGIFNVLYVAGIGLVVGVSVLAAQAHGAHQPREAGDTLRHGLVISVLTGVGAVTLLTLGFPLLRRLGEPPEVLAAARPFLILIGWSTLPALVWQCFKQYCEALLYPLLPMLVMLGAVVLNVFGSWVLIYGHLGAPAMGLVGAGWATLGARTLVLLVTGLLVLRSPRFRDTLPLRWLERLSWQRMRALLGIGFPVCLQLLLEVGTFSLAAVMMGWLGAPSLAAHQVAVSYAALTFMFPLGIASAVGVRVSQAVGAGEWGRVRTIGFGGIGMAVALMSCFAVGFLLGGGRLAGFFIRDAVTAALAARLLLVAGVFQVFDGTQVVSMNALRGLPDMRVPTLLAFVSYWLVALPAAYFIGIVGHYGPLGIWWGLAAGLAFAATTLLGRFLARTQFHGGQHKGEPVLLDPAKPIL